MRAILILIGGAVMLLSSLAHGLLGWPAMRAALGETAVGDDLLGALGVGWHFGSAAMAAFGTIVVLAGARLRRGDRSGLAAVRVIALCYVVFGIAALLLRDLNPHFVLFVITGLIAGLPALGGTRP